MFVWSYIFGISFKNKIEYMPESEMRAASDRSLFYFVVRDWAFAYEVHIVQVE